MSWTVETLNENVDAEIDALPRHLRGRLLQIMERVELAGLENMREPHVKPLEDKLWEIRAKAKEGIARGIYITAKGRWLIVLHVFVKKSQKTPKAALETARQRMKEIKP
ncbi:MAG: type II toxin-antitoxin system RelE/ParE family toxin [Candidatus Tokpelaia sp.]|nr:MAG: type II toxin-antitoxin system RelE/ParE family toxin [Candidatus Tokpelaia sp.]KAA6207483.1 MAG: type II toxin-antitoxin system RelE/ParE family toxin [Candidatus Tokpelaia sp.]